MSSPSSQPRLQKFEIPGRVAFATVNGGLAKAVVTTKTSTAEVFLHGAQVTGFQKNGEPPLLFLSSKSYFAPGKAIRGGVPVCFPWFGPREGKPIHGFARMTEWELVETAATPDGSVTLNLQLPETALGQGGWPAAKVNFIATIGDKLAMELVVANTTAQDFIFEDLLHTYFAVADIAHVSIRGLNGAHYIDKTDNFARKLEAGDEIRISSQVDRVFLDTPATVVIHDAKLRRRISVEKTGSASTVVWNPWTDWAKATADFGDEEYKQMLCVESGNVGENKITLAPGATAALKTVISSLAG
jgi:D-hexose-6-phosphate mutarotase